jgi:hypothetical protein
MALKIMPHGRLQEWVADEKGYFTAEGLEYSFVAEGDYGIHPRPRDEDGQITTGAFETFGTGERIVFLPYTREVFAATQDWVQARKLFPDSLAAPASYDETALA